MRDVLLGIYALVLLAGLGYGFWRSFVRGGPSERITSALKKVSTLDYLAKLDQLLVMVRSLSPKTRARVLKSMDEIAKLEEEIAERVADTLKKPGPF